MKLTPMMQQYMEIKNKYTDCILFYRLGDFYEMFFDDALTASREMEITLTARNCGLAEKAPMCGVPFHAADTYIAKLIEKGYKVAICEQTEDPAQAKGIVTRDVVRVITPGTVLNQSMLSEKENNYLMSIYYDGKGTGIAFGDVSTGELKATEFSGSAIDSFILNEIAKVKPKEIVLSGFFEHEKIYDSIQGMPGIFSSILTDRYYEEKNATAIIMEKSGLKTLTGIGLDDKIDAVKALGALLIYITETQKAELTHMNHIQVYDMANHMSLDRATLKSLEITSTVFENTVQGSLLGILDKTSTSMGGRKLKQWLKEPLNRLEPIKQRLDGVESLSEEILIRNHIKEHLKKIYDLERLSGRIACGNANARDFVALHQSLSMIPQIKEDVSSCNNLLLDQLNHEMDPLPEVCSFIESAIVSDPPFTIKEGGIIREGFSKELDEMKDSIKSGQEWIANLEAIEKERTGIKSLKVGFNRVFGYYIEITKSYYDMVPDNYIRKQTLANAERFITPELKEVESVVLNAETKINQLEYEIFAKARIFVQDYIHTIQKTANALACIDVLVSFSYVGELYGYVKPEVNDSDVIQIIRGRHPVIEQFIKDGVFIANDIYIDHEDYSLLLITGPNMAGKSTYMRQTALIVLMAQIGCFVPCDSASIGITDRIYTRIGASDNLSQGQSTFLVEMSELAYILNTATEKSLVILDEIGRGTSTYDGLSIAWAAAEYLCRPKKKIKTLFATHYHELTALEGQVKGMKNLNVDVHEENGDIIFLHKIVQGSASRSYGIHVAKLAGVPKTLLDAAQEKLYVLENSKEQIQLPAMQSQNPAPKNQLVQLSFFDTSANALVEKLKNLNLWEITPGKALLVLEELQKEACR